MEETSKLGDNNDAVGGTNEQSPSPHGGEQQQQLREQQHSGDDGKAVGLHKGHNQQAEGKSTPASSASTGKVATCDDDERQESITAKVGEHGAKETSEQATKNDSSDSTGSGADESKVNQSPESPPADHDDASAGKGAETLIGATGLTPPERQDGANEEVPPPPAASKSTLTIFTTEPPEAASVTAETVVVGDRSTSSQGGSASATPSTPDRPTTMPTELILAKINKTTDLPQSRTRRHWPVFGRYASSIAASLKLDSASRDMEQGRRQQPGTSVVAEAENDENALKPLEDTMGSKTDVRGAAEKGLPSSPMDTAKTFSVSDRQSEFSAGDESPGGNDSGSQNNTAGSHQTKTCWHSRRPVVLAVLLSVCGLLLLIFACVYNLQAHLKDKTGPIIIDDEPAEPPFVDLGGFRSRSPSFRPSPSPTLSPVTLAPTSHPSSSPTDISQAPSSYPTVQYSVAPSHATPTAAPSTAAPSPAPSSLRGGGGRVTVAPSTAAPTQAESKACRSYPDPPPLPGKKGVCMTLRPKGEKGSWIENLPRVEALNPHWNYRWGLERIDAQPEDFEFVPMQWGAGGAAAKNDKSGKGGLDSEKLTTKLAKIMPQIASGQVKRILGFNEPDVVSQSNISPAQAAQLWPHLEDLGLPLVSPSCAHPHKEWMEEFMAIAAKKCLRIDWVGYHWYGGPNVGLFKAKLMSVYEKFAKPIMVTEFAVADWNATKTEENRFSEEEVLEFAKEVIPWMEAQDWITGYAWFSFHVDRAPGTTSALFDAEGQMTQLGRYYASVRANNPEGDQSIGSDEKGRKRKGKKPPKRDKNKPKH